ncbi:MAG: SagB/ThcOx family dehydrogenase [Actinobacteria bacterium]|nr:SagB/ThcOx family dehydrogenase [Actinomycetota bacterium]
MRANRVVLLALVFLVAGIGGAVLLMQPAGDEREPEPAPKGAGYAQIPLPAPEYGSATSVEEALLGRRSVRDYEDEPLTIAEVSQLLWAAQGITDPSRGLRTAPSAGALYPLEVYVVVGNVDGVQQGVYRYVPLEHALVMTRSGDAREELAAAALGQTWVGEGSISIVLSAVYERTTKTYGDRGIRYVHMEVGHSAQNVCLQAVSLGLGAVVVGAFEDDEVREVLNGAAEEHPLYVVPIGKI